MLARGRKRKMGKKKKKKGNIVISSVLFTKKAVLPNGSFKQIHLEH
jgi:hypothetical protein